MTPTAFPLCWPLGQPRSKSWARSPFNVPLARAVSELEDSLRLFGEETGLPVRNVVISSNVSLACLRPADPGVAVYFEWDGDRCIAVDRFATPEANLRAIFTILEGRRQDLRCGGLHIVRAAFHGFAALPAPPDSTAWHAVLGVPPTATAEEIHEAYKARARALSAAGDEEGMRALNVARDRAKPAA